VVVVVVVVVVRVVEACLLKDAPSGAWGVAAVSLNELLSDSRD
jgi:hypothetical protein